MVWFGGCGLGILKRISGPRPSITAVADRLRRALMQLCLGVTSQICPRLEGRQQTISKLAVAIRAACLFDFPTPPTRPSSR